jgi:hypothetical protein
MVHDRIAVSLPVPGTEVSPSSLAKRAACCDGAVGRAHDVVNGATRGNYFGWIGVSFGWLALGDVLSWFGGFGHPVSATSWPSFLTVGAAESS